MLEVTQRLPTRRPPLLRLVLPAVGTTQVVLAATPLPSPEVTSRFLRFQSLLSKERNRRVGTPVNTTLTRRLVISRWADKAGTQLRRTATEMAPGEAVQQLTRFVGLRFASQSIEVIRQQRAKVFQFGKQKAQELLPKTVPSLTDDRLRRY